MSINIDDINSNILDVLKEIGNIGSGNAATALANMISKRVNMDVPQTRLLEFKDVSNLLGGEENPVVGIYFEMKGDVVGNIMFVLDLNSAKNLTEMLYSHDTDSDDLTEMDISALSEIGNIISSSYVNSLSELTGLKIKISVPSLSIDMAGAILSVPAIQFGHIGDHVLFVETKFEEGKREVIGNLFLIPEIQSFTKILNGLGVL
ncbi:MULTISPECIES: chemotaxis protein CheC [Tissierellales]|jgi:chemotaxis protein CheC|uniref:Chemotaxis protein CheC n=1 Tax=Acidilutibacter cellobiosedens TaxID=2507161 RepID=A0A410QCB5_9FIRM|nr:MULTISPECIES: chemotaxis protein CheC [Tissierellales]MBE6081734.1 chemotaxis protein CheC [Tissierellaceae bacterium]QAT61631.1 chemotaxis protein CheC [Acidilutibacter cellobiosedens]SCL83013.1 CheY-P phosphatase CheC [Sporanaerobacter sp. PP17-6a]